MKNKIDPVAEYCISPANPGYVVSGRTDGTGILKVVRPSLGAGLETLEVAP